MATAPDRPYTPEDLLAITDRPTPELVGGQLVERPEMGQEADAVATTIIFLLVSFTRNNLPGVVNGPEAGYQIFAADSRKVRFPDVSLTRRDRLPGGKPARGYSTVAPDLVVAVISPNDHAADLREKLRDFLDAGVPLVWVVNPSTRDVAYFRADGTGGLLREADTLTAGDVLPGFSCPVSTLFE